MEQVMAWLKEASGLKEGEALPETLEELFPALRLLWQRQQAQQEQIASLSAELSFYKEAINAQPNPIFIKNDQLRFVFFNRRYKEFFGIEDNQFLGMRVTDLDYLSPEERDRYQQEDQKMLEDQTAVQCEAIFRSQAQEQEIIEALYWSKGFSSSDTRQRGVVGEIVDISKEKMLKRELTRHMAALEQLMEEVKETSKTDPGTKLYNRRILTDELPAILKEAKEEGYSVCSFLTDIDDFKYINDTYGHPVGDEVLVKFAKIMQGSLRQNDITIRYGGDEFSAVLMRISIDQAKEVAERFRDRVCRELWLPGGEAVTISVGVSEYRPDEDMMQFFARTDEALYRAKKSGRTG